MKHQVSLFFVALSFCSMFGMQEEDFGESFIAVEPWQVQGTDSIDRLLGVSQAILDGDSPLEGQKAFDEALEVFNIDPTNPPSEEKLKQVFFGLMQQVNTELKKPGKQELALTAADILKRYEYVLLDHIKNFAGQELKARDVVGWGDWAYSQLPHKIAGLSQKDKTSIVQNNEGPVRSFVVRSSNRISPKEFEVIKKRKHRCKQALQTHGFNSSNVDAQVPTVAVVCSGGGLRASLATLGWLVGAEAIGLLDAATWISSLSGSTWLVGSWIQTKTVNKDIKVSGYRDIFCDGINNTPFTDVFYNKQAYDRMLDLLNINYAFDRNINSVNLWGASIANTILYNFGKERQKQKISNQTQLVESGSVPIPIYTAISADTKYWYEFTPWEVSLEPSGTRNALSVPMIGLGRSYNNGKSVNRDPEISLGFAFGIFGSAMAVNIEQALQKTKMIKRERELPESINFSIFSGGLVPNFMKGMSTSPFKDDIDLNMADAGLAINLPYPSISGIRDERKPDIIIFVDASEGVWRGYFSNIEKMKKYADKESLKLPESLYEVINDDAKKQNLSAHAVTIFESNNVDEPTVIYMPLTKVSLTAPLTQNNNELKKLKREGYDKVNIAECCKTTKGLTSKQTLGGTYSFNESVQISKVMELNVRGSEQKIWNTIISKADALTSQEMVRKEQQRQAMQEAEDREDARRLQEAAEGQTLVRPPKSLFRPDVSLPEQQDEGDGVD